MSKSGYQNILTKNLLLILVFFLQNIFAQEEFRLKISPEKIDKGYSIYADNDEFAPMSVMFDFELNNMKSTVKNKQIIVIPSKSKKFFIGTVTQILPNKSYSFKYSSRFNIGNSNAIEYDQDYVYELPFEKGKTHLVFQGYNGTFSHKGQNALDFNLKEGDKVFAAREGTVIALAESSNRKCSTADCAKFNNFVRILHSDGSFAEYAHLKYNGVEVNEGDTVKKGQLIGYSGSTGWATGPHLHFSVYFNRLEGERTYLPTKFRTQNPAPEILKEDRKYKRN